MRLVILLFVFLWSFDAVAQNDIKTEFLQKLKDSGQSFSSISSQFTQIQEMSVLLEKQEASGNFYYMKPDKMKWDQQKPTPYYFLFNGDNIFRFDGKEKKQLASGSPQVLGFKRFLMGAMDGSLFSSDDFESSFMKEGNKVLVVMIPKKKLMKRRFEQINFKFDYERMVLLELIFMETGGDTRAITFFNHQINKLSDTSNFE